MAKSADCGRFFDFERSLKYAVTGFASFKNFISTISSIIDIKKFKETDYFSSLLGVFLGLKPIAAIVLDPEFMVIIDHLPNHIKFYDGYTYNLDSASEILEAYRNEPGFENLNLHDSTSFFQILANQDDGNYDLRRGILFGYPKDTVKNYVRHDQLFRLLFVNLNEGEILTTEEKSEITEWLQLGLLDLSFGVHESYFREIFRKLDVELNADDYQILYRRQYGELYGVGSFVCVGKISMQDFDYCQKVNEIFVQAGAYDYLNAVLTDPTAEEASD